MYNTSEAYKEQIRNPVRDYSYMRIQFKLTDPDADTDAEVHDNGGTPWSKTPSVIDAPAVSERYVSLEQNRWLLNGGMRMVPDKGPYKYQAFVGNKMSGDDGYLEEPTTITIDFDEDAYSFRGFTIVFDTIGNDYPAEFCVQGSLSGTLVYEKNFIAEAVECVVAEPVPGEDRFLDRLVFSFKSTALPYRRVRIEELILGLRKAFDENSIVSAEWRRTNDLMNTVLPDESMSYTFYDPEREYNPDNPEGIWAYVETGQQVSFQYGYQLEDGTVEWIPGSTYYIDGSPTAENGSMLSKVTFNTVSRLQGLTDIYDEGIYSEMGVSLYDLAETVLRWAGVVDGYGNPLYVLDESLKAYITTAPLPVQPVREILQVIANAGMCTLYTDRNGYIVFGARNEGNSAFNYTFADIKDKAPTVEKYPYLKNLSVTARNVNRSDASEELASVDVADAKKTEYVVEYDAATDIKVTFSDGLTADRIVGIYAYRTKLILTGSGKVTVIGVKLNESIYIVQKACNPIGEDCALENPFICNQMHAMAYLEWMSQILMKRNLYSFDDRGFPEVDALDSVSIDTAFTPARKAHLTSIAIKYSGGLSGHVEVLG